MIFQTITTPRLELRKLTPEVYQHIFRRFKDEALLTFLGLDSDEKLAIEKAKFKGGMRTHNKSFVYFQIIMEDKIIGWCGFHTWYLDHARAEIGYGLFDDAYKRKGIMTEALEYIIPYGFDVMKLNRIEALTATYNEPSLKLIQNFGFTREGLLRKHYFTNGDFEDSVFYSLLKTEFNP